MKVYFMILITLLFAGCGMRMEEERRIFRNNNGNLVNTDGESDGGTGGATDGETSGDTGGETAGESGGDTGGGSAGETTGETAGETEGGTAGETAGETQTQNDDTGGTGDSGETTIETLSTPVFDANPIETPARLFDNNLVLGQNAYTTPLPDGVLAAKVPFGIADIDGNGWPDFVLGTLGDPGIESKVTIIYDAGGVIEYVPFPGWRGAIRVAAGDVDGDGFADVAMAAGLFGGIGAFIDIALGRGGGPHVVVYSPSAGKVLMSFFAFEDSFRGGVNIALGRVTGAGKNGKKFLDVIAGCGPAREAEVRVFSYDPDRPLSVAPPVELSLKPYPGFAGGVYVAAGNLDGQGHDDIATAADFSGGPHVKVFRANREELYSWFANPLQFYSAGLRIAVADLIVGGTEELIIGSGYIPPGSLQILTPAGIDLSPPGGYALLPDFVHPAAGLFPAGWRDQ